MEIQWPVFTPVREWQMALVTGYGLVPSPQGITASVVCEEGRGKTLDRVARFTCSGPFKTGKLSTMGIPVAILACAELHRGEPLDRPTGRRIFCCPMAAIARNTRVLPSQGKSSLRMVEVTRCPDLPTGRGMAAFARLLELLLVRIAMAIRATGKSNAPEFHRLDIRAGFGVAPLACHCTVFPRQGEGRPCVIEPGSGFPRGRSVTGPAVLRQLALVRILVTVLTRRAETEEGPLPHQRLILADVPRCDVARRVAGAARRHRMLPIECEPDGPVIKRVFLKADQGKGAAMMFLVAFDARLIPQPSVIPRPCFESRFHLAVTVEALCPHNGLPDLVARRAVPKTFKRGVRRGKFSGRNLRRGLRTHREQKPRHQRDGSDIQKTSYHIHVYPKAIATPT